MISTTLVFAHPIFPIRKKMKSPKLLAFEALLQELIERDKQLAKLEAEVKAMRDRASRKNRILNLLSKITQ